MLLKKDHNKKNILLINNDKSKIFKSLKHLILNKTRLYLEPQQQKLAPLISNTIKSKQQQLAHQAALLNSVNPLEIMQRGFAVVKNAEEKLVKDVDQVNKNDQIKVQLRSGHLHATVNTIEPK